MYQPKEFTITPKEKEVRNMVAFVDAIETIKDGLAQVDAERAKIADVQAEAQASIKNATFTEIAAGKLYQDAKAKYDAIDAVVQAAEAKAAAADKTLADAQTLVADADAKLAEVAKVKAVADSEAFKRFCSVMGFSV